MIKFVVVLHRRSDLTRAAFRSYLEGTHGRLAENLPGLRRYVQNHPVDDPGREAPAWDAVIELSWDDRESMERAWSSPEGVEATSDLEHLADLEKSTWSIVEEVVRR